MALDDKLYQRGLEFALALSMKELPTVTIDVEESQDKSNYFLFIYNIIAFVIISLDEHSQRKE